MARKPRTPPITDAMRARLVAEYEVRPKASPWPRVEDMPASLRAGANRLFIDQYNELIASVRRECDAMAKQLELGDDDDGLAAVKYLATETLRAVRQERSEQPQAAPRRRSGSHRSTQNLQRDWNDAYGREVELAKDNGTDSPKRRREIRETLAQKFVDIGYYGRPRGNQPAWDFIREKLRAAKHGPRKSLFLAPPTKS